MNGLGLSHQSLIKHRFHRLVYRTADGSNLPKKSFSSQVTPMCGELTTKGQKNPKLPSTGMVNYKDKKKVAMFFLKS